MAEQFIVPLYRLELVREKDIPYRSVEKEQAAAEVFHEMLDSSPVEKLAVIHCNSHLEMIGAEVVAVGTVERVSTAMSDLFKGAIRSNAPRIWLAHNHVDGNVTPSPQDYRFTMIAKEASYLLGIAIVDHLVIGPGKHYSINNNPEELAAASRKLESEAILNKLRDFLPPVPSFNFKQSF